VLITVNDSYFLWTFRNGRSINNRPFPLVTQQETQTCAASLIARSEI